MLAAADGETAANFCQSCGVAFHRLRRASSCSYCQAPACQFCCWRGSDARVVCKGCQPQVKGDQPSFSFRQFLWRIKVLPFACRGEKWLFLMRKRQFQVTPTEMSAEDFHHLARLHYSYKVAVGSGHLQQQRMIDLDIERTFQQLQNAMTSPKRTGLRVKPVFSMTEFMAWKAATHQLLSVFIYLKPQIGYCQGMTHLAATLVQESKLSNEVAFRLFLGLTEKYKMDHVFGPDMKDINLRFFQLDEMLRLQLPRLHSHLSDRDVHPATYASSWILTLFTDCKILPHRMVLAFLDMFFDVGWKAFYQVCLALFATLEPALLRRQSADQLFAYLSSVRWFHTHKSEGEIDRFFVRARSFKITSSLLEHLQGEFSTEASMSVSEYD